jgi:hypothetical protein
VRTASGGVNGVAEAESIQRVHWFGRYDDVDIVNSPCKFCSPSYSSTTVGRLPRLFDALICVRTTLISPIL